MKLFVSGMRDAGGALAYVTVTDHADGIPAEVRHADLYAVEDAPALDAALLRTLATLFVAAGVDLEINGADLYAAFDGNRLALEATRTQHGRSVPMESVFGQDADELAGLDGGVLGYGQDSAPCGCGQRADVAEVYAQSARYQCAHCGATFRYGIG